MALSEPTGKIDRCLGHSVAVVRDAEWNHRALVGERRQDFRVLDVIFGGHDDLSASRKDGLTDGSIEGPQGFLTDDIGVVGHDEGRRARQRRQGRFREGIRHVQMNEIEGAVQAVEGNR